MVAGIISGVRSSQTVPLARENSGFVSCRLRIAQQLQMCFARCSLISVWRGIGWEIFVVGL